ncbi:hypothetical protein IWW45_003621 [Coemansia sp. RSA 485]|nr:hypothetical protein IWW45_003621 [Coemansia sp. RSA 485]
MAHYVAFGRFGCSGLLSAPKPTSTIALPSVSAPALTSVFGKDKKFDSTEPISRGFKNIKCAIKRKLSKAASKPYFRSNKADKKNSPWAAPLFDTPGSTVFGKEAGGNNEAYSPSTGRSSITVVDRHSFDIETDKPVSKSAITATVATNLGLNQEATPEHSGYLTDLDGLLKHYLDFETICAVDPKDSGFWRTEGAYKARLEAIKWLASISMPLYTDRKALHLGVQYLDELLCSPGRFIGINLLKHYALACFYLAKVVIEGKYFVDMPLPDVDRYLPKTAEFRQAMDHILQALSWRLCMTQGVNRKKITDIAVYPTMIEFLVVAFERASIELSERFSEKEPEMNTEQQATYTRKIAMQPFNNACRLANLLLCDHDNLLFRCSELAAACFLIEAQPEKIDPNLFRRCTGHTIESIESVIVYARAVCGLS